MTSRDRVGKSRLLFSIVVLPYRQKTREGGPNVTLKESVSTTAGVESLDESMETLIVGSTVGPAVIDQKHFNFYNKPNINSR